MVDFLAVFIWVRSPSIATRYNNPHRSQTKRWEGRAELPTETNSFGRNPHLRRQQWPVRVGFGFRWFHCFFLSGNNFLPPSSLIFTPFVSIEISRKQKFDCNCGQTLVTFGHQSSLFKCWVIVRENRLSFFLRRVQRQVPVAILFSFFLPLVPRVSYPPIVSKQQAFTTFPFQPRESHSRHLQN